MNSHTDTAGQAYPDRKTFEEAKRHRNSIISPVKPKPKVEAVKILQGGKMIAGQRRESGDLLIVMPDQPPLGFITKESSRELLDGGYVVAATPEEIEAFLSANETPTTNQ